MAAFDMRHPRALSGESSVGPASSPRANGSETHAAESTITGDHDADRSPATEPPPQSWGHLEQLEKIGHGEFGDVYRAWDRRLERDVALKLSRADNLPAGQSWGGLQEARLLARIQHPNVVTVYGADRCDGRFGVWMEYIRGRTLEALLQQKGRLSAREAGLIGLDLCAAVSAVHNSGLLHRDIKAKNVMRERGGRIVLMDFGLSMDIQNTGVNAHQICGTPVYMAPELLRREPATVRSDIYSVGVLLYHLVTGAYPVEARSLSEVRNMHERGETRPLEERRDDLPEHFVWIVAVALAADPDERFGTAQQMAEALKGGKE
jgi:serine/threonine-protein kinase